MTDEPQSPPPPALTPRQELWRDIRTDYLTGISAPVLSERYGPSVRTIRRRAAIEGWRRSDQPIDETTRPWPGTPDREAELEESPELAEAEAIRGAETFALLFAPTAEEMRSIAFRRSAEAAAMDRPAEAVVWMRLVQQLDRAGDRIDAERRAFSRTDHLRAAFMERMKAELAADAEAEEFDGRPGSDG